MHKYIKEIILNKKEISKKCQELAIWINNEYKNSKKLIIIGILKGSFPFLSELIKYVNVIHTIEFMMVSSYNKKSFSSGKVKILMDLEKNIKGYDLIVVEDIVDTGITLLEIVKKLKMYQPKSLKTMVLLDKKLARKVNFHPDKVGFEVPNEYLVGYGLDIKGKFRHLPYIAIFNLKEMKNI